MTSISGREGEDGSSMQKASGIVSQGLMANGEFILRCDGKELVLGGFLDLSDVKKEGKIDD